MTSERSSLRSLRTAGRLFVAHMLPKRHHEIK